MRKNKTVASIFKIKGILIMLKKNYEAVQKTSQIQSEENKDIEIQKLCEDDGDLNKRYKKLKAMGKEEEAISENEKEKSDLKAFKEKIMKVLEEGKMGEKRACKMDIMDFLNLLNVFNNAGIHFK